MIPEPSARRAAKQARLSTPAMSEDTMGFLNAVWYEAPDTESSPPISTKRARLRRRAAGGERPCLLAYNSSKWLRE